MDLKRSHGQQLESVRAEGISFESEGSFGSDRQNSFAEVLMALLSKRHHCISIGITEFEGDKTSEEHKAGVNSMETPSQKCSVTRAAFGSSAGRN